jgi:hydrogenase maturation factor HypF (carbamoyltransferase family)
VGTSQFQRLRAVIRSAVLGVGFRPFVYRLVEEMNLKVESEAVSEVLCDFLVRIEHERSAIAFVQSCERTYRDPVLSWARFRNTLMEMMIRLARARVEEKVVVSGGCIQTRCLTERAIQRLRA